MQSPPMLKSSWAHLSKNRSQGKNRFFFLSSSCVFDCFLMDEEFVNNLFIYLFVNLFTYLFVYLFSCLFICLFVCFFSCLFTYSYVHSLTHSLIHSFIHSFTHPLIVFSKSSLDDAIAVGTSNYLISVVSTSSKPRICVVLAASADTQDELKAAFHAEIVRLVGECGCVCVPVCVCVCVFWVRKMKGKVLVQRKSLFTQCLNQTCWLSLFLVGFCSQVIRLEAQGLQYLHKLLRGDFGCDSGNYLWFLLSACDRDRVGGGGENR